MHLDIQWSIRRAAQPSSAAWAAGLALAKELAATEQVPVRVLPEVVAHLHLDDGTDPRRSAIEAALTATAERTGLVWDRYQVPHYDQDDLSADLFVVTGVGLDGGPEPFLASPEVIGTGDECPVCGSRQLEHRRLTGPIRIRPGLLGSPAHTVDIDGEPGPTHRPTVGWDAVNLVNGALVVSARLREATGPGLPEPIPVLDERGGPLTDEAVLRAARTVRICAQHSHLPPDGVCPGCGLVLAEQTQPGLLSVRARDLAEDDLVSDGMHEHGPIIVRRGLLQRWQQAGVEGISPIQPMLICDH